MLPKYGNIPQYVFEFSESLIELNASFKSNTDNILHVEAPNTENEFISHGCAKLFLAILMFKCLKYVTSLLSFITFLLINMTRLE